MIVRRTVAFPAAGKIGRRKCTAFMPTMFTAHVQVYILISNRIAEKQGIIQFVCSNAICRQVLLSKAQIRKE